MNKIAKSILLAIIITAIIVGLVGIVEIIKKELPQPKVPEGLIYAADFQYFDIDGKQYFQFELDGMMCVEQVGYAQSLSCVTHGN